MRLVTLRQRHVTIENIWPDLRSFVLKGIVAMICVCYTLSFSCNVDSEYPLVFEGPPEFRFPNACVKVGLSRWAEHIYIYMYMFLLHKWNM